MAWRVEVKRTAEHQMRKLDPQVQRRVTHFLRRLEQRSDPRESGKPLRGEKSELWRYRVGDYRIICDLRDSEEVVVVLALGHRREVYR